MASSNLVPWNSSSFVSEEASPSRPSPSYRRRSTSLASSAQMVLERKNPTTQKQASPVIDRKLMLHTPPDPDNYASLLRECIGHKSLPEGMQVHDCIMRNGLDDDRYLGNILVEMYDKCGALEEARLTFDSLKERNVYTWNNIIAAYTHRRHDAEALHLFHEMLKFVPPTNFTFSIILGACANLEALDEGKWVHDNVVYSGFDIDIVIGTALLNMYGKCGSTSDAERVFNRLCEHNVVSFTAMIAAYVQQGQDKDAVELFRCILKTGNKLDEFCLSTTLGACSGQGALDEGRFIHAIIVENGFESNIVIGTTLINMYGKCGNFEDAEIVFAKIHERNVTLVTALITAYVQLGQGKKGLQLFRQMQQEGLEPNEVTFVSIISACSSLAHLVDGKVIYHMIVSGSLESDFFVASAIVNMFGKCGCPEDAHIVFDKMCERTVVIWNALITAYVQQGDGKAALELFCQMLSEGVSPTEITFVNILSACGMLASLPEGKSIHMSITKHGLESHGTIGNALVSMYGKCWSLKDAIAIFSKMPEQDVISWNAIIAAYTQYGHYNEAFQSFKQMQQQGVRPDEVTFISVLSACSHAGLVLEGLHYFFSMSKDFDVEPRMEHYGCIIDLLGRAGQLEKAEDLIDKMPISPDSVAWKSFLAACRFHGDRERGQHAAESAIDINPQEAPPYILLSNMQAADDR